VQRRIARRASNDDDMVADLQAITRHGSV